MLNQVNMLNQAEDAINTNYVKQKTWCYWWLTITISAAISTTIILTTTTILLTTLSTLLQ